MEVEGVYNNWSLMYTIFSKYNSWLLYQVIVRIFHTQIHLIIPGCSQAQYSLTVQNRGLKHH